MADVKRYGKDSQFSALENAMLRDPSLRAIRNASAYEVALKVYHLGLVSWSPVAIVGFLETLRRSSAIERVKRIDHMADVTTRVAAATPNILMKQLENNGGSRNE